MRETFWIFVFNRVHVVCAMPWTLSNGPHCLWCVHLCAFARDTWLPPLQSKVPQIVQLTKYQERLHRWHESSIRFESDLTSIEVFQALRCVVQAEMKKGVCNWPYITMDVNGQYWCFVYDIAISYNGKLLSWPVYTSTSFISKQCDTALFCMNWGKPTSQINKLQRPFIVKTIL